MGKLFVFLISYLINNLDLGKYKMWTYDKILKGLPPGIKFEDAYISFLPIDKTKCSRIDDRVDVRFDVFTSENPTVGLRVRIGDDESLIKSRMNFSLPTIMIFHAFFEDSVAPNTIALRQGFIQLGGHNLIFIHAPRLLAGPWYVTAVKNTRVLGQYAAVFVDYLVTRGLNIKKLHLMGLSLGAQTAGICGHYIQSGRPARITGMDPAGPFFGKLPANLRLDKTDADFVDVIHSDAGTFGYPSSIGHADFWPNGGVNPQPGCMYKDVAERNPGMLFEKVFCSHWRSLQYFAESITKPHSFPSIECNSGLQFEQARCNDSNIVNMGFSLQPWARGNYYLKTNSDPPFSRH